MTTSNDLTTQRELMETLVLRALDASPGTGRMGLSYHLLLNAVLGDGDLPPGGFVADAVKDALQRLRRRQILVYDKHARAWSRRPLLGADGRPMHHHRSSP